MPETPHPFGPQFVASERHDPPSSSAERVLLINPPVYDTRLHWAKWQQPASLLRLATYLRHNGTTVKLLDAMHHRSDERLHRERVAFLDLDGLAVPKWRFGLSRSSIVAQLRELAKSGWYPDEVYVEGFTTFWWEGAAEVIASVKAMFPRVQVVLLGGYANLTPDHAAQHTAADRIRTGPLSELSCLPPDLSVYERAPTFTYILLADGRRTAEEIVDEVETMVAKHKVHHLAFAEHAVARRCPKLYRSILEKLAGRGRRVNLYALGNVSPADLIEQPDLPGLMRRAGYVQIFFSDDRDSPMDPSTDDELIGTYRRASLLCHEAGFPQRTEALTGGLCLGRPGEDVGRRARVATFVAHHAGSVIFWPYQPLPNECPQLSLEEQNGKLFPLRGRNGLTYRDYLEVLGLGVVLNAKYRQRTFDFLGDGLISRLFQDSVARRGWDPDPEVKGSLRLPLVAR